MSTIINYSAVLRELYSEQLESLIPDGGRFLNMIRPQQNIDTGNMFYSPVILGLEHGVTFKNYKDDRYKIEINIPEEPFYI